jgi:hypothetical protein
MGFGYEYNVIYLLGRILGLRCHDMVGKLDSVEKILRSYLDIVDPSPDFLEGEKFVRLPSETWLWIELRYTSTSGLTVDRISENKNVKKGELPSYGSLKEATKEYVGDSYVKGLLQKINADIKRMEKAKVK